MRTKYILLTLLLIYFLIPTTTFAQLTRPSELSDFDPVSALLGRSLGGLITRALFYVFTLAGILSFVWAFIGVFQYITAGGDKEGLSKAKKRITWALIGLIFLMIAFILSQFIRELFNIRDIGVPTITPF